MCREGAEDHLSDEPGTAVGGRGWGEGGHTDLPCLDILSPKFVSHVTPKVKVIEPYY